MSKPGKELYVGSLSFDVTEYDLEKLFSVSGTVTSLHLICDNKTGEFKGCGYVRMSSEAEARDAIASLDGAMLIDRRITVSIANLQKMKAPGGYKGKSAGTAKAETGPARTSSGSKPARPAAAKPTAKPAFSKADSPRPGSRADAPKPGSRADSPKPAFSKADSPRPGFSKTDAGKPGSARPGAAKAGFSKPGTAKAGFSKPGAAKAGFSKPGAAKTGFSKPGADKSGTRSGKR